MLNIIESTVVKVGRNDLCPCGSGKKYKKCCVFKDLDDSGFGDKIIDLAWEKLWRVEHEVIDNHLIPHIAESISKRVIHEVVTRSTDAARGDVVQAEDLHVIFWICFSLGGALPRWIVHHMPWEHLFLVLTKSTRTSTMWRNKSNLCATGWIT